MAHRNINKLISLLRQASSRQVKIGIWGDSNSHEPYFPDVAQTGALDSDAPKLANAFAEAAHLLGYANGGMPYQRMYRRSSWSNTSAAAGWFPKNNFFSSSNTLWPETPNQAGMHLAFDGTGGGLSTVINSGSPDVFKGAFDAEQHPHHVHLTYANGSGGTRDGAPNDFDGANAISTVAARLVTAGNPASWWVVHGHSLDMHTNWKTNFTRWRIYANAPVNAAAAGSYAVLGFNGESEEQNFANWTGLYVPGVGGTNDGDELASLATASTAGLEGMPAVMVASVPTIGAYNKGVMVLPTERVPDDLPNNAGAFTNGSATTLTVNGLGVLGWAADVDEPCVTVSGEAYGGKTIADFDDTRTYELQKAVLENESFDLWGIFAQYNGLSAVYSDDSDAWMTDFEAVMTRCLGYSHSAEPMIFAGWVPPTGMGGSLTCLLEINAKLEAYAVANGYIFIDLSALLEESDTVGTGNIQNGGVHLNSNGFPILARNLANLLREGGGRGRARGARPVFGCR